MIDYESTHKRFRDARDEYHRLEYELAAARAKMNAAERECLMEWRKLLDNHHPRAVVGGSSQSSQK